jgi:hypothetical protein
MTTSKFILFAHARSGSTSLTRSLNLHPDVKVAEEPFAKKYSQWHRRERNYIDLITDIPSLDQVLSEIFSRFDGMKTLDYQLPEETYTHMLLLPQYKVILLHRRNLLQTVVSGLIAEQTSVWHISHLNAGREEMYKHLSPLSMEEIQNRLNYQGYLQSYYSEIVHRKPEDSRMQLYYEDFYSEDLAKTRNALNGVFTFIGVPASSGNEFDCFLDPKTAKINDNKRYQLIPNADEINARFGNDNTGWLF